MTAKLVLGDQKCEPTIGFWIENGANGSIALCARHSEGITYQTIAEIGYDDGQLILYTRDVHCPALLREMKVGSKQGMVVKFLDKS